MEISSLVFISLAQDFFFYVIALIFALLVLITLHEYGHYLAARAFGVRVNQFSVGFGRELFSRTDKNGTKWSLLLWPIGGYVKIFGDYDVRDPKLWDPVLRQSRPLTPEELSVAFCTRSVWKRMIIVLAGPAINFFPAIILLAVLFCLYGQSSTPPVLNAIDIGASGYTSGLRLGDEILEIDGTPVRRLEDVWDRTMKDATHTFALKVQREQKVFDVLLKPDEEKYIDTKGVERSNGRTGISFFYVENLDDIVTINGISTEKNPKLVKKLLTEKDGQVVFIGVRFRQDKINTYQIKFFKNNNEHWNDPKSENLDKVYFASPDHTFYIRMGLFESLQRTFGDVFSLPLEVYKLLSARFQGKNNEQVVAGIPKMSKIVASSAKEGVYSYIIFLCIFSIQLAMLNLLPIPVLDGGYMVFLIIEAVRRRPVSQKTQNYAFIIGMVLLLGIMVFANLSDIYNFLR